MNAVLGSTSDWREALKDFRESAVNIYSFRLTLIITNTNSDQLKLNSEQAISCTYKKFEFSMKVCRTFILGNF